MDVSNEDEGEYILNFKSWDGNYYQSEFIKASFSADEFYKAVNHYYLSHFGCYSHVSLVYLDVDGTETDVVANQVTKRYDIGLTKMIYGTSVENILVLAIDTLATIDIILPTENTGVLSLPPLGGNYRIQCINGNNEISLTNGISYLAGAGTIQGRIETDCYQMRDKIIVREIGV